jgi:hypothetical protein
MDNEENKCETKKYINGPINVARLEGKVHGINKVIYIFMDYHEDISKQTECQNLYSKDIDKYLAKSFYDLHNSQLIYDFFLEIAPSEILTGTTRYKNKYIESVVKLFKKIFTYNVKEDRVIISDVFRNIRLHYFDIRGYLEWKIGYYLDHAYTSISSVNIDYFIKIDTIKQIINDLTKAKMEIAEIVKIFRTTKIHTHEKRSLIKEHDSEDVMILYRLINKMKYYYRHMDIKNILVKQLDEYVEKLEKLSLDIEYDINLFWKYHDYINNHYMIKVLHLPRKYGISIFNDTERVYKYEPTNCYYSMDPYLNRKMIIDIVDRCESLFKRSMSIFARITDIFFLRRFLDKEYITNAIIYSGLSHSAYYICILVYFFNFKITHISYSVIPDLVKLEQEIRKKTSRNEFYEDLFFPEKLNQCSDLTHFPVNFS